MNQSKPIIPPPVVDRPAAAAQEGAINSQRLEKQRALHRARSKTLHGRTKTWLLWDLFTVAVCGLVFLYCVTFGSALDHDTDWELRQVIYWLQVLYSMLSLPFMLFTLPLFHLCFSAAPASGYTRLGKCVPLEKVMQHRTSGNETAVDNDGTTAELVEHLLEPEPELEPEHEFEVEQPFSAPSPGASGGSDNPRRASANALPSVPTSSSGNRRTSASALPSVPTVAP